MKTKFLHTLLIIITVILSSYFSTFAQIPSCPASPPPSPPGSSNCQWSSQQQTMTIVFKDGSSCQADLYFCERCCDANPEFLVRALVVQCTPPTSYHFGDKMIQDQIRAFLFARLTGSQFSACVPSIPLCPDKTEWGVMYSIGLCIRSYSYTDPVSGITWYASESCNILNKCTKLYKFCIDANGNIQYTFLSNGETTICPYPGGDCTSECYSD